MIKPVLIDFWAPWCQPCVAMKSVINSIEAHYGDGLEVFRTNVDEDLVLADRYDVRSIPTLVFLDANGDEVMRLVGGKTFEQLKAAIDLAMGIK